MTNSLPKLLITGGRGQLATALRCHSDAARFHLHHGSHDELDITDAASIDKAIATYLPDIIINTAAYTAVDKAEEDRQLCNDVNHLGAQRLAAACHKHRIPLIHLSTDYVFAGNQQTPYRESDPVNPLNVYGSSKWLGEQAVREQCDQHLILRVSGVFSEFGHNFLKTIYRLAQERKELRMVADQKLSPTYATDIAQTLFTLSSKLSQWGTYHYCSAEQVSWFQFATEILANAKKHRELMMEQIHPITTAEYPTAAKRPAYSVLDCSKIARDYHIMQPSLPLAINNALNSLLKDSP